jgi:hypothetical protein
LFSLSGLQAVELTPAITIELYMYMSVNYIQGKPLDCASLGVELG